MYEECEVHEFPINAFDIAKKLLYNVIPYSKLPVLQRAKCRALSKDGCSELTINEATGMYEYNIYYNDEVSMLDSRIQFTIMHEIGHIRLGHLDEDADKDEATKESEANFYASYSIAPPPMVDCYHVESPIELSIRFNTSGEMAWYAYERYTKWLNCSNFYTDYEIHMMSLFGVA